MLLDGRGRITDLIPSYAPDMWPSVLNRISFEAEHIREQLVYWRTFLSVSSNLWWNGGHFIQCAASYGGMAGISFNVQRPIVEWRIFLSECSNLLWNGGHFFHFKATYGGCAKHFFHLKHHVVDSRSISYISKQPLLLEWLGSIES